METTLDKFGRIVIPKEIRDHVGIGPGSALVIEERRGEIVLRPARLESFLADRGGITVFTGKATGDLARAVQRERERRISELAEARGR